jgi:hypothetical protein
LFSNGLNFASIKGKGKDFASYGFKFLGHGTGEPVDAQGKGFPLLHPGSKGAAVEPKATGKVGAKVSKVDGGVDVGLDSGPGVVGEPLSGFAAAGERKRFSSGDARTDVDEELEGVSESLGEVPQVVWPAGNDKDVVSKDPWPDIGVSGFEDPWAGEQRNDHHAERTSLGDAFLMVMWFTNVTAEAIVDHQVLDARNVWSENAFRETSSTKSSFNQLKDELVEAFVQVGSGPCVLLPDDFEVSGKDRGGVPGVFGRVAWDTSEHVIEGPAVYPRGELPESAGGPPAVEGGQDEKGAHLLGGGMLSFGLQKEGSLGTSEVAWPSPSLLDSVEENHEQVEDGVAKKRELGSRPSIQGGG